MAHPLAVVTGAGSGIGRAISRRLAGAGYRVVLAGRRRLPLEETAAMLEGAEAAPLVKPADVSTAAGARALIEAATALPGDLEVLVNNAGVAPRADIEATDQHLLQGTFAVNVFGAAHLIAAAWPVFRRRCRGCVVNVSSLASSDPFPGFFVYAATKSAVESLARSAAVEGRGIGVRAYSVAPGAVEAPSLRRLFSPAELPPPQTLDPDVVALVVRDCVLGRRNEPSGSTIALPSVAG